uniref:Uncharacterized protein n=1 Tax=Arundo donax TaxID=35708 RepID=A0A0A9E550_ARUDO
MRVQGNTSTPPQELERKRSQRHLEEDRQGARRSARVGAPGCRVGSIGGCAHGWRSDFWYLHMDVILFFFSSGTMDL